MVQHQVPSVRIKAILEGILGSPNVWLQAPGADDMTYPAILFSEDFETVQHASNLPYFRSMRYMVTHIDTNPNSQVPDKLGALPNSRFVRRYVSNNLVHKIYNIYF
jgi:hypothetical protein